MPGVLSTARQCSSILNGQLSRVPKNGAFQQLGMVFVRFKSIRGTTGGYQYIQKSLLPTDHFQHSLPRLPVPKLEDTCARYLRAQKPLLDTTSYEKTEAFVKEFLNEEGKTLQKSLVDEDKKNKHTSYITKHWFDIYLSDRKPLPINYNPFLVHVKNDDVQIVRATNLVISSLRFYRSLTDGMLEPEVYHMNPAKSDTALFRKITGLLPKSISWYGAYLFKAFPLDMSQYKNLFNSTRIPETGKDRIKHSPGRKHISVMLRGHFYVFDVLDKDGNLVAPDVILSNIGGIMRDQDCTAQFPVGVLTTENRDVWADARKHLESLGNSEVLDLIDSSLFNLCLDEVRLGNDRIKTVEQFLHSNGVNRWFDKSFSLIVTEDGTSGINFEHSWGDGVAVLRYFNDTYMDSKTFRHVCRPYGQSEPNITKLKFKLDDKAQNLILDAKSKFLDTTHSLNVRLLDYKCFGRSLCKPLNISPDALMQLSFQMAYSKMTGTLVPTYESCSTAAFKHGRTETVRPCTVETKKFCEALKSAVQPSKSVLQKMIIECSKQHSKLIKEAAMGQGFDRHLLALKLKAEAHGLKPALFDDPAYSAINHNILSTSTLSSENIELGAFGPVVPDGFGIGYSIWKDRLGCIVTNYKGHSDSVDFLHSLSDSLDKLHDILGRD